MTIQGFKEVTLPSGAILKIQLAPFADAKELYKAILRELKTIKFDMSEKSKTELGAYILEGFCGTMASDEVEAAVHKCMTRCLYNNLKINNDTFEPESAREDYLKATVEVAKENIFPFLKALFAEFTVALKMTENIRQPT